jgi:hypothetical protein
MLTLVTALRCRLSSAWLEGGHATGRVMSESGLSEGTEEFFSLAEALRAFKAGAVPLSVCGEAADIR